MKGKMQLCEDELVYIFHRLRSTLKPEKEGSINFCKELMLPFFFCVKFELRNCELLTIYHRQTKVTPIHKQIYSWKLSLGGEIISEFQNFKRVLKSTTPTQLYTRRALVVRRADTCSAESINTLSNCH